MSDINIEEWLEVVDIPNHLLELVKDNLEVVPTTIYKLKSKCSEYEYTKEELEWSNDHIRQLVTDILLANLDKIKYQDNRIYKFLNKNKSCWMVKYEMLYEVNIVDSFQMIEIAYEKDYDYILTEYTHYCIKYDLLNISMFNNNNMFLKFGNSTKFFETKEEGLACIKEQNG